MKQTFKTHVQTWRAVFLACLLLSAATQAFSTSSGSTIDLSDGTTLSGVGWKFSGGVFTVTGDVTITGKTTANRVVVAADSIVNITLDNANIRLSTNCAFNMAGATVNLTLIGADTLISGGNCAGLQAPTGSTLIIGGSSGSLYAQGGNNGAGIGGGSAQASGSITITNGSISAQGGNYGAGIGGGAGGAGIGGGNGKESNYVTILGGTVVATGANSGAGIGGGAGGAGGNVTIISGTVSAIGGAGKSASFNYGGDGGGAGIGGGGAICGGTGDPNYPGGGYTDITISIGITDVSPPALFNVYAIGGLGAAGNNLGKQGGIGAKFGSGGGSGAGSGVVTGQPGVSPAPMVPNTTVQTHTITAIAGTGGKINPTGSIQAVKHSNQVFTVTPDAGYEILSVTVGSDELKISNKKNYTFVITNVTGNQTVTATFVSAVDNTTTTVVSNPNPSVLNQSVTLTATVVVSGSSGNTPTGQVQFREGTTTLGTATLNSGTASITVTGLSVGIHTIAAYYLGNSSFNTSNSGTIDHIVNNPNHYGLILDRSTGRFYLDIDSTGTLSARNIEYTTGSGTAWTWNSSNGTLTLNNFTWETPAAVAMRIINSTTSLVNISLTGTNAIKSNYNGSRASVGIHAISHSVSFSSTTGTGSLTVTAGNSPSSTSDGIQVNELTLNSGSLSAIGGNASTYSRGLNVSTVTVAAGTLSATGGTAANCYGVLGTATINGGTVNATADKGTTECNGFRNNVTINGEAIITSNAVSATSNGDAFYASVTINGGTVVAIGSRRAFNTAPTIPTSLQYTYWTNTTTNEPTTSTVVPGGSPFVNSTTYKYVKIQAQKNMSIGSQSLSLTYGTAGSTSFTVTTSSFLNSTYTATLGGASSIPGVSISSNNVVINNNTGTFNINTTSATPAGSHNLTLTLNGITRTFTLDVSPRSITVTANQLSKTYGSTDPALTYTVSPSLVGSDVFTGSLSRVAGENVGTYNILQNTLSAGSNYTITFVGTGRFSITAKAITVTALGGSSTYGNTSTNPGLSANGLAFSETISVLTGLSNSFDITPQTPAGTYTLSVVGTLTNGNYTVTRYTGTWVVNKRPITIQAKNETIDFGETPVLAYDMTSGNLVNGDQLTGKLAVDNFEVGTHVITIGTLTAGNNYQITYIQGTLIVRSIDFSAKGIYINGQPAQRENDEFYIMSPCGDEIVNVSVDADSHASITVNGKPVDPLALLSVNLPKYGNNIVTVIITAQNGNKGTYKLTVDKPVTERVAFYQRWDDVLSVYKEIDGIGEVNSVKWYLDGVPLDRDTSKGYIEIKKAGAYSAVINGSIHTCEAILKLNKSDMMMSVYPNPATAGQDAIVNINGSEEDLQDAKLKMFGVNGQLLRTIPVTGNETKVEIPYNKGVTVIRLFTNTGNNEVKLIVK